MERTTPTTPGTRVRAEWGKLDGAPALERWLQESFGEGEESEEMIRVLRELGVRNMLRLDGLELEDLVRAGATRGAARTVMNRAGVIMKEMGQTQEVEAKAPTKSQPRRLLEQFSGAEDCGEKNNDEKKRAMAKACGALGLEFKEGEVNRDGMPNLEAFERKVKVWILNVKPHHKVIAHGMAEIMMLSEGLDAPEVARVVERLTQEMGDTEGWNDLLGDVWAAAVASCRELEDSITFEASMSKRGGLALFSDVVRYVKARTAGTTEDTKHVAEKPKMCKIPALLGRRLRRWDSCGVLGHRSRGLGADARRTPRGGGANQGHEAPLMRLE